MKTKKIIIFILILINILCIGCYKNSKINENDNSTIFFFPIYPAKINNSILAFISEFITYTEKRYGKDNKYALCIENMMADRHLITIYLLPKNEKIDIEKYNGFIRFKNKIVFIDLCTESIFERTSKKEEIIISDYKHFCWQLILTKNIGEINKVMTENNDTISESNRIITGITEMKPNSFDTKPLEEKVRFKPPLKK
jgi:hypothetical protein